MPRGWGRHGAWSGFDGNVKACTAHFLGALPGRIPLRRWPCSPEGAGSTGGTRSEQSTRRTLVSLPRHAAHAKACRHGHPRAGRLMIVAWSTFGPHPIGAERFATVSSGRSFAQVAGAILRNRPAGRTLIRMRSQVQVLAVPPTISAAHATPAHHRRWPLRPGCPGSCHPQAGVRELSGAMIPMLD